MSKKDELIEARNSIEENKKKVAMIKAEYEATVIRLEHEFQQAVDRKEQAERNNKSLFLNKEPLYRFFKLCFDIGSGKTVNEADYKVDNILRMLRKEGKYDPPADTTVYTLDPNVPDPLMHSNKTEEYFKAKALEILGLKPEDVE